MNLENHKVWVCEVVKYVVNQGDGHNNPAAAITSHIPPQVTTIPAPALGTGNPAPGFAVAARPANVNAPKSKQASTQIAKVTPAISGPAVTSCKSIASNIKIFIINFI